MMTYQLNITQDAQSLRHIDDSRLINHFIIRGKSKDRWVNNPTPELKAILKKWNPVITRYYMNLLKENGLDNVAHAYLPSKSIRTNASCHITSDIIQFDFKGFYDTCKFEYFRHHLVQLDPLFDDRSVNDVRRLLIDPTTNGVTQGLPVSGALAGLSLIPFWVELKRVLPNNITFTQYSDDLTFSYTDTKPPSFNVPALTNIIYKALRAVGLNFQLNNDKTRVESKQYRKVTGVRINHKNQMTPSRNDYRFLKHALYILSKSNDLNKELAIWGFESKESFIGKISYLRSIDDTNKINNTIMKYQNTCKRHNLFTKWINRMSTI